MVANFVGRSDRALHYGPDAFWHQLQLHAAQGAAKNGSTYFRCSIRHVTSSGRIVGVEPQDSYFLPIGHKCESLADLILSEH
jgi:hypothetical protein